VPEARLRRDGHLTEFGEVVPQGAASMRRLIALIEGSGSDLPETARATLQILVDGLRHLDEQIAELDAEIARRAREDETARRLMTIPGIGPLIATALATLAPPPEHFRRARDFAAWLGLTPRQHSTGGKQRLGATIRMGERSLRRLLILGANSVVIKRRTNPMAQQGTWLGGLLARKPGMLVRVALANKLARIVWALMAWAASTGLRSWRRSPTAIGERRSGRGQGAVWRSDREAGSGHPGRNRVPPGTRL